METLGGNTEQQVLSPGTVLEGKYRIARLLGSGGMGAVYAGTHLKLDKRVAVKVLQPALADRDEMVQRMLQEARAAGSIGHPNIVAVTDLGEHAGAPFIVMEYLEGESLSKRIQRGPMPLEEVVSLVSQGLDALAAVHGRGIVHRDLKPENMMVVEGAEGRPTLKILDFGISKIVGKREDNQVHTKTGTVLGTPAYMSPEQALGVDDLDGRSDVHSMGSLMYALLVGKPPFLGGNATATLARIMEGQFKPASQRVPGLPREVDHVLAQALARDRDKRFSGASVMRDAVRELLTEGESDQPSAGTMAALDAAVALPLGGETALELDKPMSGAWPDAGPSGRSAKTRVQALADDAGPAGAGPSKLELDVPKGWKPGGDGASDVVSPLGSRRVPWGWYALLVVVIGGGVGAFFFSREIDDGLGEVEKTVGGLVEDGPSAGRSGETVLILVDPKPKSAIIYVDDVQRDERPIELPKSDEPIKIRAEAPGYRPYSISVTPQRTRRVKIELKKK